MIINLFLPGIVFFSLLLAEKILPTIRQQEPYTTEDAILNWIGLFFQGCLIPTAAFLLGVFLLPSIWPDAQGVLKLGWWGCFILNFVFIDFLYYWQHRACHHFELLWKLHHCHHASPRVDIWTTSRNSLLINFLFVYFLLNPLLGFLCDSPEGFFTGVALTASLDVFRHTNLDMEKLCPSWLLKGLSYLIVMPKEHHGHHHATATPANFSANFIVWDILFGTARIENGYPLLYKSADSPSLSKQLFYPFNRK